MFQLPGLRKSLKCSCHLRPQHCSFLLIFSSFFFFYRKLLKNYLYPLIAYYFIFSQRKRKDTKFSNRIFHFPLIQTKALVSWVCNSYSLPKQSNGASSKYHPLQTFGAEARCLNLSWFIRIKIQDELIMKKEYSLFINIYIYITYFHYKYTYTEEF